MKKSILLLTTVALIASLASCGSDNNDTPDIVETIALDHMTAKTIIQGRSVYDHDFNASAAVNLSANTLTLNLNKVKFAEKMPEVNFSIADIPFKLRDNVMVLSPSATSSSNGDYKVTGLKGSIDAGNKVYNITFRVNDMYDVILSGTFNCSKDYNTNSKFYTFSINNATDKKTLRLGICNVKFVEGMPTLKEMAVYLNQEDGCSIVSTTTGYTFECEQIIPLYKEGNTETPMETRPMSNVKGSVDLVNRTFSIEFDCYGLHYTDSGTLYL